MSETTPVAGRPHVRLRDIDREEWPSLGRNSKRFATVERLLSEARAAIDSGDQEAATAAINSVGPQIVQALTTADGIQAAMAVYIVAGYSSPIAGDAIQRSVAATASARRMMTGMIKHEPYADYLQTQHWADTREAALERAKHRCQLCNAEDHLQVHHRTYERLGHELDEDLTVLCSSCHASHHERVRRNRTRLPSPRIYSPRL